MKLVERFPETREDEVQKLRNRFFEDIYEVRADLVVEKMIQHGTQILTMNENNDNSHFYAI